MAYTLQAIVGQTFNLTGRMFEGTHTVALRGGITMIPLGTRFLESYALPLLPLMDTEVQRLPSALQDLCSSLATNGPIAYVEAEFFGGVGRQAAVLFHHGGGYDGPLFGSDTINQCLRQLGVVAIPGSDEFDTVGLGMHRETDAWLSFGHS